MALAVAEVAAVAMVEGCAAANNSKAAAKLAVVYITYSLSGGDAPLKPHFCKTRFLFHEESFQGQARCRGVLAKLLALPAAEHGVISAPTMPWG